MRELVQTIEDADAVLALSPEELGVKFLFGSGSGISRLHTTGTCSIREGWKKRSSRPRLVQGWTK